MTIKDLSRENNNQKNRDNPYGIYIYFFDELRGHIPLFAYPPELLNNQSEKKLIMIHPIWWHQDKILDKSSLETIDLELEGTTFVATIFLSESKRKKRRFGMESEEWKHERFVLIFKAPSSVSFIAQEILFEFKSKLQEEKLNLTSLVEASFNEQSASKMDINLHNQIIYVKERLTQYCEQLIPRGSLTRLNQIQSSQQPDEPQPTHSKKLKKLSFSIPSQKKVIQRENQIFNGAKRIKITQIERKNKLIRLTLQNLSPLPLQNVRISVYQSQNFFSNDYHALQIEYWMPNEDCFLEFELKNNNGGNYFIRIEDDLGLIKLRKING